MNIKHALAVLATALASGCASTPQWDMTQFPEQPVYGMSGAPPQQATAEAAK